MVFTSLLLKAIRITRNRQANDAMTRYIAHAHRRSIMVSNNKKVKVCKNGKFNDIHETTHR